LKMTAFSDIALCSLVEVDRRFRGGYFIMSDNVPLKRRSASTRLHGAVSQKAVIFVLAAVRT
jgi:hypothetical protein